MADALRVAMVIQRFRPVFSGQGIQVEALAQALARRDVEVTIITATSGRDDTVETCDGYSVVRLGVRPPGWIPARARRRATGPTFAARTFAYLQQHGRFALAHVHAMTDALYATYGWCRLHDRPVVFELTLLGTDDPLTLAESRQRLAGLRRAIYRRCDGYVVMSPALETACLAAGLTPDRIRLIPQGVDVRRFAPVGDRSGLRRELGLPDDGPIVAFVGSLIERKGIDVMLEAWPTIQRECPTARLVLIGRDSFEGDPAATRFLDDRLADVPEAAAGRVERLGLRDDVAPLLAASDVFAFPSRREGFGTVMIEAMACGVPPVVAELPGITDFVFGDEHRHGVVIPQDDPVALATAVQGFLRDPVRAGEVGRAARSDVVDRFDIDDIAGRYVAFYEELLSRGRRRG